ncbi:hypothetical protein EBU71_21085, partial [bacterium]|nr:hypothetical protein [Candidatus Elulimicrobium humile]
MAYQSDYARLYRDTPLYAAQLVTPLYAFQPTIARQLDAFRTLTQPVLQDFSTVVTAGTAAQCQEAITQFKRIFASLRPAINTFVTEVNTVFGYPLDHQPAEAYNRNMNPYPELRSPAAQVQIRPFMAAV